MVVHIINKYPKEIHKKVNRNPAKNIVVSRIRMLKATRIEHRTNQGRRMG